MTFRDITESLLVAYDWRVLWIRDIIVFFDQKASERPCQRYSNCVNRPQVLRFEWWSYMESLVLRFLDSPCMSPFQYVVLADSFPLSLLRLGPWW